MSINWHGDNYLTKNQYFMCYDDCFIFALCIIFIIYTV